MDYVGGYTVAHDVSARDWQLKKNGGQWLIGKSFDTFCPLGPVIVTPEDFGFEKIHNLGIRCYLNDEIVQVIITKLKKTPKFLAAIHLKKNSSPDPSPSDLIGVDCRAGVLNPVGERS